MQPPPPPPLLGLRLPTFTLPSPGPSHFPPGGLIAGGPLAPPWPPLFVQFVRSPPPPPLGSPPALSPWSSCACEAAVSRENVFGGPRKRAGEKTKATPPFAARRPEPIHHAGRGDGGERGGLRQRRHRRRALLDAVSTLFPRPSRLFSKSAGMANSP
jgi:hypothetical protein